MMLTAMDWSVQRQRIEFDRPHFKMSFGLASSSDKSRTKIAPARASHSSSSSSSGHKHGGRGNSAGSLAREIVVVAINATKGVTRYALEWALTNVVHPGDSIVLLALLPPVSSGWKFWQTNHHESPAKEKKRLLEAKKSCQNVLERLQSLSDARKVHTVVKLIPAAGKGVTTLEAKKLGATWVLLDRNLKSEEKGCTDQLECNLVIVKRNDAKILRLNLKQSPKGTPSPKEAEFCDSRSPLPLAKEQHTTPLSSPDVGTPFTLTDRGNSPASSSTSPYSSAEPSSCTNSAHGNANAGADGGYIISESDGEEPCGLSSRHLRLSNVMDHSASRRHPASESITRSSQMPVATRQQPPSISRLSLSMREGGSRESLQASSRPTSSTKASDVSSPRLILSDFLTSLRRIDSKRRMPNADRTTSEAATTLHEPTSVRKAVSLSTHAPLGPPPLCSICQHKAPAFGRPPRAFTFKELELATGGFSQANFLAEGGFGSVHRGILPEGQVVAVKQHKLASSQGDVEFCSEVEVLSCAQHRNVVMLIGYCIEDSRRLLVYEYICNGSLDAHIYGRGKARPLAWQYRRKIAVGAARGLRYLHEECRVGCIVHRDMRPNNILLTHDYEPMVGDFGLARWQPDGELGVETRVIGTFGYLAPEYTQSGQITEKADVYSFGVVLLELVTGRKAIDINRPKGQQCLTEWARMLLRKRAKREELVDPMLEGCYDKDELDFMLHAASLCISRDPNARPRMSQVLRILEGDLPLEATAVGGSARLSYDGHAKLPQRSLPAEQRRSVSAFGGRNANRICSSSSTTSSDSHGTTSSAINLSLEELKAAYRDKMAAVHGSRRLSLGDVLY